MSLVKWILSLLIAIALAVLFAQNSGQSVDLRLFGREFLDIPLYYVIAGSFLMGILVSIILGSVREIRLRGRIRSLDRTVKEKDGELTELRTLPLQDLDDGADRS
jgi:uncharacterized integral membrane protein